MAQVDGSFERIQARLAANAFPGVPFNVPAGQFVQFIVDVLGQLCEHGQAAFHIMGMTVHFQNTLAVFLLEKDAPGEA